MLGGRVHSSMCQICSWTLAPSSQWHTSAEMCFQPLCCLTCATPALCLLLSHIVWSGCRMCTYLRGRTTGVCTSGGAAGSSPTTCEDLRVNEPANRGSSKL